MRGVRAGRAGRRRCTPCRPARRPARSGRRRRSAPSPTSAPSTRCAPSAICDRRRLADHRPRRHPEQVELDLAGVGHDRAAEHVAGAGDRREPAGDQPAGQRLGEPERQPVRRAAGRARPTPSTASSTPNTIGAEHAAHLGLPLRRAAAAAADRRRPCASSAAPRAPPTRGRGTPASGRRLASSRAMTSSSRSLSPLSLSPHVCSTRLAITAGLAGPRRAGRGARPARPSRASRAARRARRRPPCRRRPTGQISPGAVPRVCGMTVAPTGHHRLAQVVLRHRAGRGRRTARGSRRRPRRRCTSSTPITAAIASRVRSSWVGPSPPHDDHGVGVGRAARRSDGLDAADVVADLDLQQRVDAVGGQLLADPRRVGVDDLAEQQLGPDRQRRHSAWQRSRTSAGHGRQRDGRGGRLGCARAGTAAPLSSAARRPATGSRSTATWRRRRSAAARAKPTASCWTSVLYLAIRLAGTLTPLRADDGAVHADDELAAGDDQPPARSRTRRCRRA